MIDLTSIKTLGIGGVAVAVATGWTTVKAWLNNLSAYLIIHLEADNLTAQPIKKLLRTEWSTVPSGIHKVFSTQLKHRDGKTRLTPFRILGLTSIFYSWKRKAVVVVTFSQYGPYGSVSMWTLRGMLKYSDFIREAITKHASENIIEDRFRISEIRGHAGSFLFSKNRNGDHNKDSVQPEGATTLSDSTINEIDVYLDESLLFNRSDFLLDKTDDPLKALFYPETVLTNLNDATKWYASKDWYARHSIPWRRGWLLYGPGGTGKSSLAVATAKTLRIPLISFALATFTDEEFIDRWRTLPTPCVVLFEDIDTVFEGRVSMTEHKSLTFECILNQLSGVNTQPGVFLIVTTNRIETIDPALGAMDENGLSSRPGRIDRLIYVGVADEDCRMKYIKYVLADWPDTWEEVLKQTEGMTMVKVQETCVQIAYARLQ